MTTSQLIKLINLSRCQLLTADTGFIKKLEALPDDCKLTEYEAQRLNKMSLDYAKQIKRIGERRG